MYTTEYCWDFLEQPIPGRLEQKYQRISQGTTSQYHKLDNSVAEGRFKIEKRLLDTMKDIVSVQSFPMGDREEEILEACLNHSNFKGIFYLNKIVTLYRWKLEDIKKKIGTSNNPEKENI